MPTTLASQSSAALSTDHFPPRVEGRIPSLDGLRAVAILLVIASHIAGKPFYIPILGLRQRLPIPTVPGEMGVRVFFVISGLLITTLLLQEQQKRGKISLGKFYIRRALRILPACYAYLLLLIAATTIWHAAVPRDSIITSFLYLRNYDWSWDRAGYWYTAHLWSLSVEEQFYLIWPAMLVLLGKRRAVIGAVCSLPLANLARLFFPVPYTGFEKNMDALACGCILACLWGYLGRNERWQRLQRSGLFWAFPIVTVALAELSLAGGPLSAIFIGLSNICIAIVVERFIRYHEVSFARLLNTRPFVALGTLSYSLYLWQQPWLTGGQTVFKSFPLNVLFAGVCAVLSYAIVERPFLRLRDRMRRGPTVPRSLQKA